MNSRYEIRLAGEGGQGLLLLGDILAEALTVSDERNLSVTTSYGAQQRGGDSRAEIILSPEEIDYPEVIEADFLLALGGNSLRQHEHEVKENGLILADSSQVDGACSSRGMLHLPLIATSREATGTERNVNMVALGAITEITGIVSPEASLEAMERILPTKFLDGGKRAFEAGRHIARQS